MDNHVLQVHNGRIDLKPVFKSMDKRIKEILKQKEQEKKEDKE